MPLLARSHQSSPQGRHLSTSAALRTRPGSADVEPLNTYDPVMTRSKFARAAVAVPLVLALVGAGSPAAAATDTIRDKANDAPAHVDLTQLKISETQRNVTIAAHVRNLGRNGTLRLSVGNGGEMYHAVVTKTLGALTTKIGTFAPEGGQGYDFTYRCGGLKARWDAEQDVVAVTIALPECFGAYDFVSGARLESGKAKDTLGPFSMSAD